MHTMFTSVLLVPKSHVGDTEGPTWIPHMQLSVSRLKDTELAGLHLCSSNPALGLRPRRSLIL